ncbi:P1 family peptidase [Sphingosinicellaceae bacterium]|nr:P1 family peptidase [Sphingosinicellaceae bacterium]
MIAVMTDRFSDVHGLDVGHADDPHARTGVSVILPHAPVVMGVDVRGGAPGTRETDALAPDTLVERVHALVLSGGSVFGLAAADAVAVALSRRGIGLEAGPLRIPVVPAAILFDLTNGGDKGWDEPPYRTLALAAMGALDDRSGPVGAGAGARAGSRPGGIGSVSVLAPSGHRVGALVAVNSFGEAYAGEPPSGDVPLPKLDRARSLAGRESTCIGVIATDAPLTRAQATRLAAMAHDGLARSIRPVHTMFDGDCLFALSTAPEGLAPVDSLGLSILGTLAADMVAKAVRRAVFG